MFIKVKRTQVGTSGTYRAGVIYKIDEKDPHQVRDAKTMSEAGFAAETTKKEFEAIKAKASKSAVEKVDPSADESERSDKDQGGK